MADYWWVNDDTDNDFHNANNWSATEGGAGGSGIPGASDNALFSATSSNDNCILSDGATTTITAFKQTAATTGGTDNYTGVLELGAANTKLVCTALSTFAGTLRWNALTTEIDCTGLTGVSGALLDFNDDTHMLRHRGNYTMPSEAYLVNRNKGHMYYDSGTYNVDANHDYRIRNSITTLVNGAVVTALSAFELGTMSYGGTVTLAGTITPNNNIVKACAMSAITIEDTFDVLGANGDFRWLIDSGATVTNNKTSTYTFSNNVGCNWNNASQQIFPEGDWSNAKLTLYSQSSVASTVRFESIKAASVETKASFSANDVTLTFAEDAVIEIGGNIDLTQANWTLIYTQNRETWKLTGGPGATVNWDGKVIHKIIVESGADYVCTGDTYNYYMTVDGSYQLDNTAANNKSLKSIYGTGTLSATAATVYDYKEEEGFTGTLTNVTFNQLPGGGVGNKHTYYGLHLRAVLCTRIN